MSDEERKAIEIQDSISILENTDLDINSIYSIDLRTYNMAVQTVLNLTKKQSKEIEELKENNKNLEDELNKYIVKMSDEQYRRLVDIIRDEINKLWKDKIKAKIEEYEKEIQIRKNVINNDVLDKQTIEKARIEWACMEDFIYEMQSLLEKE